MRIGLIAMSGLRVCDHSLLQLGLSFPGVRSRAQTIEALPSLGLLTLAAFISDSHEVEYLEVRELDEVPSRFDVVFLSFLTATAPEAYRLAEQFRKKGTLTILGGLHVTLNAREAQGHGDVIIIGEGEPVMTRLMDDLEQDNVQSIYRARDFAPFDFCDAPLPRFDLLKSKRYTRFTVQTQRGCPLRCSFCASSIHLTPRYQVKPVHKVIEEIRAIKALTSDPFIEFADDNTFCDRKHSRKLMRELAKEKVPWFTESDISVADDPELLSMIRDAGCRQILIGLEAPSAKQLDGLEQRSNWKAKRADQYLSAVEQIQSHGITVNGCFVLGLDSHDSDSFDEVFDFVERSGLYEVQITYLTPFPGTPMHRQLSDEGRILLEGAHERCTLFDINFQPAQMSVEELRSGFHALLARLYHPREVKQRARRFLAQVRKKGRGRFASSKEIPLN